MDRLHTKGLEWGPAINVARYTSGGRLVSSGPAWASNGGCWAQAQCRSEDSIWVPGKHSIRPLQGPGVTHAVHRSRSKRPIIWGAEDQGPQNAPWGTPARVSAPPLRPNSAWPGPRNGVGTPFFRPCSAWPGTRNRSEPSTRRRARPSTIETAQCWRGRVLALHARTHLQADASARADSSWPTHASGTLNRCFASLTASLPSHVPARAHPPVVTTLPSDPFGPPSPLCCLAAAGTAANTAPGLPLGHRAAAWSPQCRLAWRLAAFTAGSPPCRFADPLPRGFGAAIATKLSTLHSTVATVLGLRLRCRRLRSCPPNNGSFPIRAEPESNGYDAASVLYDAATHSPTRSSDSGSFSASFYAPTPCT